MSHSSVSLTTSLHSESISFHVLVSLCVSGARCCQLPDDSVFLSRMLAIFDAQLLGSCGCFVNPRRFSVPILLQAFLFQNHAGSSFFECFGSQLLYLPSFSSLTTSPMIELHVLWLGASRKAELRVSSTAPKSLDLNRHHLQSSARDPSPKYRFFKPRYV